MPVNPTPPGTTTDDTYVWIGGTSGSWDTASNWQDATAGQNPALVPPGANDTVAFTTANATISGIGAASILYLDDPTIFTGQITTGQIASNTGDAPSALTLDAGAGLTDSGTASVSSLTVNGGTLSVTGATTTSGNITAENGAVVNLGNVLTKAAAITVDSTSSLEIGGGSTATAGELVVDAGASLTTADYQPVVTVTASSVLNNGTISMAQTVDFDLANTAKLINNGELDVYALTVGTLQNNGDIVLANTLNAYVINTGTLETGPGLTFINNIENTGTITAGGNIQVDNYIEGTGQLNIGAGMSVQAINTSGQTIKFTGANATFFTDYVDGTFTGAVEGLGGGNTLEFNGAVKSASYANGVLTVEGANQVRATVDLIGADYSHAVFFVTSFGGYYYVSASLGDTTTAPVGTTTPDSYDWAGGFGGSWDVAANWTDVTAGQTPAAVAPGANDSVNLTSASGATVEVTGTGAAASLDVGGSSVLDGTFSVGAVTGVALTLAANTTLTASSSIDISALTLGAGSALTDSGSATLGSVTLSGGSASFTGSQAVDLGTLTVNSGSHLTVAGAASFNENNNDQDNTMVGSTVSVAGVLTFDNQAPTSSYYGPFEGLSVDSSSTVQVGGFVDLYGSIGVDATSSFEVGNADDAAAGYFIIDAGATFDLYNGIHGSLQLVAPNFLNNGVLEIGSVYNGASLGTGQTQILDSGSFANNGELDIAAGAEVTIGANTAVNTGTINDYGDFVFESTLYNDGVITDDSINVLSLATVNGTGQIDLGDGALVQFTGAVGANQVITLAGADDSLTLATGFSATIIGFSVGDSLTPAVTATSASWSNGVLSIFNGSSVVETVKLQGNYAGETFTVSNGKVILSGPAPVAFTGVGHAVYQGGDSAVAIAPLLTLSDSESSQITSAAVTISSGFLAGDQLQFANQNGIVGSYDAATGVLTLTGPASVGAYQSALESIGFASSAADPTQGGVDASRSVVTDLYDGTQYAHTALGVVSVANTPTPGPAPTYTLDYLPILSIDLTGVANEAAGLPLTITGASFAPGYQDAGTLSGGSGLTLTYIPAAGFTGPAVANVTISDGQGDTIVQTVDLNIVIQASTNPPPPPADTVVQSGFSWAPVETTYAPDGAVVQIEKSYYENGTTFPVYVSVFESPAGVPFATTIVQSPNSNETIVQHLDGNWNQLSATITDVTGGQTVVQDFDGSWNRTDASITTVNGNETIVQQFGATWNQTSAVITQQLSGGVTETQHFDGNWNQVSANLTTDMTNGDVLSQDFDGNWNQTDATLVSHPTAGQTITQTFDGNWNQTGATVVTVNGNQTVAQDFDANWHITGGTVTTQVNSTAVTTQVDTYNAYWQLTAEADTAPDGSTTYFDYSVANAATQTLTAGTGHSTTFVLAQGTVNGDTLAGLHTLNLGGAVHDVVEFEGFGSGATVTQVNATQWVINDPTLGTHEYFTLTGGATLGAGDYFFH